MARAAPGGVLAYTTLRVSERGVVLYPFHLERLRPAGVDATRAFEAFAAEAAPGAYSLRWDGTRLAVRALTGSRLFEGIPTRVMRSPVVGTGPIAKPPPEGPYLPVREEGIASLLTDQTGAELLEACVASLVAWDGEQLVAAPLDRPRVRSTSEAAIAAQLDVRRAPLLVEESWPLLLINAVIGTCAPALPNRPAFPAEVRAALDTCFEQTARRP